MCIYKKAIYDLFGVINNIDSIEFIWKNYKIANYKCAEISKIGKRFLINFK